MVQNLHLGLRAFQRRIPSHLKITVAVGVAAPLVAAAVLEDCLHGRAAFKVEASRGEPAPVVDLRGVAVLAGAVGALEWAADHLEVAHWAVDLGAAVVDVAI